MTVPLRAVQPCASRLQIPLLELLRGCAEGAEFVDGAVGVHCLLRQVSDAVFWRVGFTVLFLMPTLYWLPVAGG